MGRVTHRAKPSSMPMSSTSRPAPPRAAARAALPLALLGESTAVRRARQALDRAAGTAAPILLVAEPGCGADAVATYLHDCARSRAPLVALDCAAAEASEMARRLFGTAAADAGSSDLQPLGRGAALIEAGTGTLVLENIEELAASAQRRLARLLRDGEARVGSRPHPVALPFRLVASTARDLDAEVRDGAFRPDLLRRFAPGGITLPPLRQRPEDVGAIIERLLQDRGDRGRTFTQPAVTVLAALPWPRNLDELAAFLERVLADAGPVVTQEDVLAHVPVDGAFTRWDLTASLREARRRFERDYIAAVLDRHAWRMSEAARALGIERANLYRKTRQLGIARFPKAHVS